MKTLLTSARALFAPVRVCLATILIVATACGPAGNEAAIDDAHPTVAETNLFAESDVRAIGDARVRGQLRFNQDADFLRISGRIAGLQPGHYVLYVHEGQACAPTPAGFAGPVFSPDQRTADPDYDPQAPVAAGVLGNFVVDERGDADIELVETSLNLGDGAHSVTNRCIVVRRAEKAAGDTHIFEPGVPVACGRIELTPTPAYVR